MGNMQQRCHRIWIYQEVLRCVFRSLQGYYFAFHAKIIKGNAVAVVCRQYIGPVKRSRILKSGLLLAVLTVEKSASMCW